MFSIVFSPKSLLIEIAIFEELLLDENVLNFRKNIKNLRDLF